MTQRTKLQIQPREICVPKGNPFEYDLLNRRESVEILTHLVSSLEGPCVLAVDAAWGNGKTTFLRIWAQYLRNEGFPVVKFNAWETDFSEDPFVALSTELTSGLQEHADQSIAAKVAAMKKSAGKVLLRAVPGVIRLATGVDIRPLEELGKALASYAEERISAYQGARESVEEFRSTLQDMAATVSEYSDDRPLIVMIDELDRCRPSYAVELLEAAKHLFSVAGIVFVLAINRDQLTHSIKALYGSDFDAQEYLRRFFDVDLQLPEPEREAFIEATLAATQIDDYFERTEDETEQQYTKDILYLLQGFLRAPDLSLRRVAQATQHLGLVFASLRSDQRSFAVTTTVALILRTIDPDLYHQFLRGEVSDLELVDRVFDRPEINTQSHIESLFEAKIIGAAQERERERRNDWQYTSSTPLLERYENQASAEGRSTQWEQEHAAEVLERVAAFDRERRPSHEPDWYEFKHAVRRIELLSPDFIYDESAD